MSSDERDEGLGATAAFPVPGLVFAGRYEIERLIGQGGMGSVYRARDVEVGDLVALKTLTLEGRGPSEAIERFRREVRLARRITHRNVARIHDIGSSDGVHYLTMEYVDGVSVERLLREDRRLDVSRAANIALEVCAGLEAAHAVGVIHRDLKPANILVETDSGRIVLTDFGIARSLLDEETALRTTGSLGTPIYMAPEQIEEGATIDQRTDLYALGILLYETLVGAPPFKEKTAILTAIARLSGIL